MYVHNGMYCVDLTSTCTGIESVIHHFRWFPTKIDSFIFIECISLKLVGYYLSNACFFSFDLCTNCLHTKLVSCTANQELAVKESGVERCTITSFGYKWKSHVLLNCDKIYANHLFRSDVLMFKPLVIYCVVVQQPQQSAIRILNESFIICLEQLVHQISCN